MGAAKAVVLPALWVCPLCCDCPPTTEGGCFDLDVCDSGLDSSVESPACLPSHGDDQTDNETGKEDEDGNGCNEKHELGVHTLLRPPDIHVLHPKRVPGAVYLNSLEDAIKSVLKEKESLTASFIKTLVWRCYVTTATLSCKCLTRNQICC
jgi:hypothetical protein